MNFVIRFVCVLAAVLSSSSGIAVAAESARNLGMSATAEKRVALVIGNGAYQSHELPRLSNPPNDAEDIAKALKGFGFEVISHKNLGRKQMKDALAEFGRRATDARAAFFYFAGHGVQIRNQNYLIPVDAAVRSEADVIDEGINVNYALDEMDSARSAVNIVMLDACRDNPLTGKFRGAGGRGLAAPAGVPKGTVIVYATDPGNTASDGEGRNGLFTTGLLAAFRGPDLSLDGVLTRASEEVEKGSRGSQTPYVNGPQLVKKNFFFGEKAVGAAAVPMKAVSGTSATRVQSDAELEQELWNRVKNSGDPDDVDSYLQTYPGGRFAALASAEIKRIRRSQEQLSQGGQTVAPAANDDEQLLKALATQSEQQASSEPLRRYLAMYPRSRHLKEIGAKIGSLDPARDSRFPSFPLELAIKTVRGNGERVMVTFEDPNCAYCKKLHQEIAGMTDITIYTFLYPILGADSVDKARTIWCSPNRAEGWRTWMLGGPLPARQSCDTHGIDRIAQLGKNVLDVKGTPTMYFQSGRKIIGFVKAETLVQALSETAK